MVSAGQQKGQTWAGGRDEPGRLVSFLQTGSILDVGGLRATCIISDH